MATRAALNACLFAAALGCADDWTRFRGPNGSGVAEGRNLPVRFGPETNVEWKTQLPPGHSSPVYSGNFIVLTAAESGSRKDAGRDKVIDEGGRLLTICLDKRSGKILWKREAPRNRIERYQPTNSPASPTPVIDGGAVYVFFGDFGLLAYRLKDGKEIWRHPLGPFNNANGHGSSPVVVGDHVVLLCDQDTGSYLLAADKRTGRTAWKVERPDFTRSYTTPAVVTHPDGRAELIVPGAYQLVSYDAAAGKKLWWVRGLSWQPKSTPIVHGGIVYAHWWENGGEAETQSETPPFSSLLKEKDADGDGKISLAEYSPDPKQQRSMINSDLGNDGFLDSNDWDNHRARRDSRNRLIAVRPGEGDLTDKVIWSMQKFLPNVPSPVIYEGVLYIVKDGGVVSALDAATGKILRQGRLPGALDTYYASPVAADGKVYFVSQTGKASVIRAGGDWEVLAVNDLGHEAYGTPAIDGERIYVRTNAALYCFRNR